MEVIKTKDVRNIPYHLVGKILIMINFIRYSLLGYRTPRTFSLDQINRSIHYDLKVVENWIKHLADYSKTDTLLKDKVILELGVGPDLGIGAILVTLGVKKYVAFDVHALAKSTPYEFYGRLFDTVKEKYPECDVDYLKDQFMKCQKGEDAKIQYIVDKNFEISRIKDKFDIVFSQAAFEHFTHMEKTVEELSSVVKSGGVLVTEIDLKTHTGWIRDRDPLNVYRHSDSFWNLFKFQGSVNRVRTFTYKELLEKNGWFDIEIKPLTILEDGYIEKVMPSLNKKFRNLDSSEMKLLSVMVMARKK